MSNTWTPTHRIASSETTKRAYVCASVVDVDKHLRNLHARRKETVSLGEWILINDDVDMLLETRNLIVEAEVFASAGILDWSKS